MNEKDRQVYFIIVWIVMVAVAVLVYVKRGWASELIDPYLAPTQSSESITIVPHRVAEGTMVSVQIGEDFIICDTTPGGLQCQSANISAIYIEEGEIHVLTYGQSGYVCTVAGCREFVY